MKTILKKIRAFQMEGAFLVLAFSLIPSAWPTQAQSFAMTQTRIGGGGGLSHGGPYELGGIISGLGTVQSAGGPYRLESSFKARLVMVQTLGAPALQVKNESDAVTIYWDNAASGFVLEQSPSLSDLAVSWEPVSLPYRTNATHVYISLPIPKGNQFYRLRRP